MIEYEYIYLRKKIKIKCISDRDKTDYFIKDREYEIVINIPYKGNLALINKIEFYIDNDNINKELLEHYFDLEKHLRKIKINNLLGKDPIENLKTKLDIK